MNEVQILSRLNHPNLVQLYAFSTEERVGTCLLVQELVEGGDLLKYLKRIKPMRDAQNFPETSLKQALSWCVQVCRGMAHLELLGIVHRDLAARNILLDSNRLAKVADFGLALSFDGSEEGESSTLEVRQMAVRWTSPEALFDQRFSHESDVWSFGILMWEVFSFGERPYNMQDQTEIVNKLRLDYQQGSNQFRCKNPYFPKATDGQREEVYSIMLKCWAISTEDRPKFYNMQNDLHHYKITGDLSGYQEVKFELQKTFSTRMNLKRVSSLLP